MFVRIVTAVVLAIAKPNWLDAATARAGEVVPLTGRVGATELVTLVPTVVIVVADVALRNTQAVMAREEACVAVLCAVGLIGAIPAVHYLVAPLGSVIAGPISTSQLRALRIMTVSFI